MSIHHLYLIISSFFCSLLIPPPPLSTLFPYTTLFRSDRHRRARQVRAVEIRHRQTGVDGGRAVAFGERQGARRHRHDGRVVDRKSTRLNSSHGYISYAVFCLKKKKNNNKTHTNMTYLI